MAMQVSTLDILIEKAHFEPQVARAVGEAIENEIRMAQVVTVPILDARLSESRSYMDSKFSAIDSKFGAIEARFNTIESRFNTQDTRLGSLETKVVALDGRFSVL